MRASDPGLSLQDAMGKIIGGLTQQIANVASGAQKPFVLNDVSIITSVTGLKGDAVLLIAEGNTISADSLDGIYEFQKLVQDDLSNILSLGGSMSAEALKSLTALLKFVSQGNKVVDFKLAPSSDTSLNESGLLTHVADPSVRVDLKPLADTVKVGDTIKLTQEGREPTTVIVTPEDVSRGYVDIKLPTFTQDGSATITVTVTDSQTQKDVAKGVVAITYDSTVTAIGAQIAPHTDSKQDDGEATATTDELGRYSVTVDTPLSGGRWVSTGGTDSFSGEVVGYLFAPAGSSVITPLTTLLAFGPEAQRAAIEANLLKVLGLDTLLADAGISSVTGFDPMAAIVSPMDGANLTVLQQAGAAVFASQQVIMTLMQTAIKLGSVDNVVQGIQTSFEKLAKDIDLGIMDGAETAEGRLALLHALNHEVIATIIAQSTTIPDSLKADLTLSVSGMLNHVTDALMANFEALALQLYKSAQGLELSVDDQLSISLAKATVASAQTSLLNAISEVLKSENPLQVAAGFGSAFDAQIENSANGSVDLPVPGNLLSVAAAKAYIAQGVDVSGRTLDASSITLADYQSLHKVAGLLLTNGVEINVTDRGVRGYSDEIDSLLGERGLDAVLNLGGNVNETVSIDETQAMGLIHAGLHFAAGDTITLNADNAEGTHLGASLKQLSKLGVDTVAVSAAGTELAFGEGALVGALPSFSANGNVTLNVNGQEQLGQASAAAGALDAAGIDTVQINLLDGGTTNGGNAGYSDELNALLGTSGLSNLSNGMDAVLNLGGSVNETVTIDEP
ncbi:hypothetical protein DAPPUDRAFT_338557, partial [Daphnia pulex]